MTFERFMELALYEPELGYYRQPADRPTDAGDFLTAPETHPIFGWTIARRIEEMWLDLGKPDPFWLIEYGAGSGTLGISILEGFRRHGKKALGKAARYRPIESNPHRVADLTRRFEDAGLRDRLSLPAPTSFADLLLRGTDEGRAEPVTGVLLANEFLDALPVHRITALDGWLLELYVTWGESFVEVEAEPSTPDLARRLGAEHISIEQLAEGQVAEICLGLDEWLAEAAATLDRGYVLVIDYGAESAELYDPRRYAAGTLLGYRNHAVVEDPFGQVGLTDLTAHVDFTALRLLGERHGFRAAPLATQPEFLVAAGLEAELQALQATPDLAAADYMRARSGIVRMLDPRHMGRFKVLTLEKPGPRPARAKVRRRN
jgi:SAM-dependent MidA family methyltransferase